MPPARDTAAPARAASSAAEKMRQNAEWLIEKSRREVEKLMVSVEAPCPGRCQGAAPGAGTLERRVGGLDYSTFCHSGGLGLSNL